ncbi:PadR family transcriptional regulator [Nocardia sp. NPDC050408]|uniref:PadR family transcriptional regulator n=1 Tax=Nocardia sp. NPDC050408 TaxID=3364319 RepID=UPI0037B8FE02
MSLRYALLALFTGREMTGYELYKQYLGSTEFVWHASSSQIYPELRQMEAEGLIVGEQIPWRDRGRKTLYSITPAGTESFRAWMNAPLPYGEFRDAHHLKAAYFEWADRDAARAQLTSHLAHYATLLERWSRLIEALKTGIDSPLQPRLDRMPASDAATIVRFKVFAYEGLLRRAEGEIAWAQAGLALLDELRPPESGVTTKSR